MKFSSIVVQDGFQIIPKYCFRAFKNLSHCTLPDSITYIGDEAFIGTKIKSFRIGPKVKLDPGNPFDGANMLKTFTVDPGNPYYTVLKGVLYSKDMKSLIPFPPANPIKSFVVPSTVVEILNFSMKNCNSGQRQKNRLPFYRNSTKNQIYNNSLLQIKAFLSLQS